MDLWEIERSFTRAPSNEQSKVPTYGVMAKDHEGRSCSFEQLPIPGRIGDFPSIKVSTEAHQRGVVKEQVQKAEEPENHPEELAPEAVNYTKNQKKRIRKKNNKRRLTKERVWIRELSDEMPSASEGTPTSPITDLDKAHKLLKEMVLIKLQSALKWADMVDDTERDNALHAQEENWQQPGRDKKSKKVAKKENMGSG
ncbi:hypothetical protein GIB67_039851 [Kingdonia uniflora]|uniref:Uncharacterized protein n=1 Tax=Kingdonia uniflora TaxID=39325 RepID=A0A7J7P3I3_9MAGN|nr:hypothetical protein GIB67_039851 [Kingdonia uniflora]